jgi:hypothetical protein
MGQSTYIRDGFVSAGNAQVTGSLGVTGGITGSLLGTATSASYIDPTFISASAAASGFTGPTTINNNTDNYVVTATGTANTLNGESALTFDGTTLSVANSSTSATPSQLLLKTSADAGGGAGVQFENSAFPSNKWQLFVTSDSSGFKIGRDNIADYFTIAGSTGYIGIGSNTPSQKLEVNGNALIKTAFIGTIPAFGDDYTSFSQISRTGSGDYSLISDKDGTTYLNAKSSQDIRFRINNIDNAILSLNGNFGIGTTTPAAKLEVNGNTRITGSLLVNGSSLVAGFNPTPRTGTIKDGVTSVLGDLQDWTTNYYQGDVLYSETAGETISFGQLCYRDRFGKWLKAFANIADPTSYNMLGICLYNAADSEPTSILTKGYVETTYITSGDPGDPIFISAAAGTAGSITATAPSTAGNVVRVIGNVFWDSASQTNGKYIISFNPDNTWIEL